MDKFCKKYQAFFTTDMDRLLHVSHRNHTEFDQVITFFIRYLLDLVTNIVNVRFEKSAYELT